MTPSQPVPACPACDELRQKFARDEAFRKAVFGKYRQCKAIEAEIQRQPAGDVARRLLADEWKQQHTEEVEVTAAAAAT